MPAPSAPNEIASVRRLSLSTVTQGKGRVFRVQKFDVKSDAKTEAVNEVGNESAAGFMDKPGAFTISLSLYEQQGKSWPDWDALKASKETITVTDQIVGGRRFAYGPARVSSVDRSGEKDGGNDVSVEIVALGMPRL